MDQTLYYTFSTTAQVLAAFLVFYGLFFLYRMEIFRKRFAELTKNFLLEINGEDAEKKPVIDRVKKAFTDKEWSRLPYRTESSLRQGNYNWIIENAIGKALPYDSENIILKETKDSMQSIIRVRRIFKNYSIVATIIGFVYLIGSLFILSLVSYFEKYCCNCLSHGLLVVNFIFLAVFVFFIAMVIIKTFLQEVERDSK
jgi:hypothetical protein